MDWMSCRKEMAAALFTETQSLRNLGDPEVDRRRSEARRRLIAWLLLLLRVDSLNDLGNLIEIEVMFQGFEAAVSQDRPTRLASITAALEQLDAIRYSVSLLRQPKNYKKYVDRLFSPAKHRVDDLPLDIGRQSLRSHITRLKNAIKEVRGPDEELDLLVHRLESTRNMERLYIALQRQALGA